MSKPTTPASRSEIAGVAISIDRTRRRNAVSCDVLCAMLRTNTPYQPPTLRGLTNPIGAPPDTSTQPPT
ncbi:hypothetical protein ACIBQX_39820 [Nonomuraea sp. NPDC049714]|uniref:hypothetical protein n=1 Tax=Nonomuraea sp. NPDC049714 TaxID=3364357 RepID=UPI00379E498C